MNRQSLSRLTDALESVKNRDVMRLKEAQAAVAALDARREAMLAEIEEAVAALDPNDLQGALALERFRVLQKRRIDGLATERAILAEREEEARQALLVSNGEVEAVRRLVENSGRPKRRGG